jgi:(R,R)-butanediol dehydrogenase/meso-butanediol dehydrogenase/diacetyl reductase
MKALFLEDKLALSIKEIDRPLPSNGEIVIEVEVAGIGGSEYLGFKNPGIRNLPSIMGHGFTGTISDGARVAVNPLKGCGTCSYCLEDYMQLCESWSIIGVQSDGGFTQKVSVPKNSLVKLPDELSWEQSAFIEPFANSIHAWSQSSAAQNSSVGIIGAGGLGLGLVACAYRAQCKIIDVSDLSMPRLMAAKELGASETASELFGAYDVVFDTVGTMETRNNALKLAKKSGTVVFLGFASPSSELNTSELIRHEKHVIGSFVYTQEQFEAAVTLAQRTKGEWVKNIGFHEVEELLNQYLSGDFRVIKAALRPNQ